MTGSYIDEQLWATVIGAGHFNYDGAIYKYWRALKSADPPQYLGVPVTPEIDTEVGTQQGFSSGAVINWSPENGAELANE
jgi:uncharacterized protein with LGFP repeats